ncbi:DHA2 family efflux MFS transporter permease subunit [Nocardioides sp. CER19]|uniref:DHA2 family efflux MFS transporter permease subunit n=1 Tax=Nocardioides sp. CER19 TaxID=3038538 RepID=UPI00244AD7B9|nr:DHA2 family efflux MFS transporter permease subunit [Nocardioides sp. CER19]MDH2416923.1 DHA2 family efflux MFS transporter permease subunit [Nocardioides sp. CER19]
MSTAPLEAVGTPAPTAYRYRWLVMTVVIIADVMDLIDGTVAQLAGPSIRRDIGGSETTLQWILAAYTLAFAVGLITSARLGDIVGRRPMFIIGMAGFAVSSLACGLAPNADALIAFRVLQGLFGATMIPQGLAMVKQSFPPEELQKAFIPFGPIMGLSAVLGPILGGFLIDADIAGTGWRAIFLINVPIGIVGAVLSWRYLPQVPKVPGARLDPLGSLLITVGCAGLIYALVQGRELGWPVWLYGVIVASLAVFVVFVWSEQRSSHPIIEPTLFTHRGFVAGVVFLSTFFVSMVGLGLVMSLFMQLGLGFSAQHAAIAQTPYALGMSIGAVLSGALLGPKLGRHVLHLGLAITIAGVAWFGLVAGGLEHGASAWHLAGPFLVAGLGSGLIFAPLFDLILADLGDNEVGSGSGLLNAVQQFSGALGVAVLGTLFFHLLPAHGFSLSTRWVTWATLACYAVSFLTAFLLPLKAREDATAH